MEKMNKTHPNARTINLKSKSKKEFFLIHGYTGCPADFNKLPKKLNKEFGANVKIPCLKGHGTKIEDLDNISYLDFLKQIEKEIEKDIKKGMKIILGGYSFGGQLALHLASKFKLNGVFYISPPIKFRFPLNIPFLEKFIFWKKYFKKSINPVEEELLKENFYYDQMHRNGLIICKEANKNLTKELPKVSLPCLGIHSTKDLCSKHKCVDFVNKNIGSKIKEKIIFEYKGHNLFFTKGEKVYEAIKNFVEENNLFEEKKKKEIVSAIVPAYNEGARIFNVLKVLAKTDILDEIIVIDDGSKDDTYEQVKKIASKNKKIKLFKNEINKGKASSMDRGVKEARGEIIFFCDADIKNFTPKIVKEIVNPIIKNEVDMFIGVRSNKMQTFVKNFAINSGERAMRRKIWEQLPQYYKHRYRIECGLNNFVKIYGKGFGYKIFPYYQTLKEQKYGFIKGTFLRWCMNFDVFMAILKSNFIDRFKIFPVK